MQVNLTEEQIDQLSAIATKAMHDEFDDMETPALKKEFPGITSGMALHTIEALNAFDGFSVDTGATEDEQAFGKNAWVYCRAHLAPHLTGWCTVGNDDKLGLGLFGREQEQAALDKCRACHLTIARK